MQHTNKLEGTPNSHRLLYDPRAPSRACLAALTTHPPPSKAVSAEFFNPSRESQARKCAFKCHRQVVDRVNPVNALSFHPVYGTFVSGGGDGVVSLWDGTAKRRLRQYPKLPASVSSLSFNREGRYLAVALSSGFEDGREEDPSGENTKIYIRELAEGEGKGKAQQQQQSNGCTSD